VRNIIGEVKLESGGGRTLNVSAVKRPGRHGDPEDVEIRTIDLADGVAICVIYPNDGYYDGGRRSRVRDHDDDDDRDEDRPRRTRRHENDDPCNRDRGWSGNTRNDTRVDFTIKVPDNVRLDAKTVSGLMTGAGLKGEIDVASVSGDVELTDVQGPSVEASTVSGDVVLANVRSPDVGAETVSGEVTFSGPIESKGTYDFKTLSGNVELRLPEQPDAELTGATFSGNLESDFPTTRTAAARRRHRFNASWGSGSARIQVESFSGNVRILKESRR
jgi:DUF4097 and DUF4098 domain-containing protein YvlB